MMIAAIALIPAVDTAVASPVPACSLGPGGSIHHVVYVQFDNTHLLRDNANVPADLEQIPALRDYLAQQGTLNSNSHTVLISHTAGGIMAALTGLYPDRNGINVSNSYGVFKPDGSMDAFAAPAFTYWTDRTTDNNPLPNLITNGQKNTPAPWVPFTRAGCDVGAFSIANMELENTKTTPSGDITKVFGNPSPEATFANWSNAGTSGTQRRNQAVANFEGIAVHCGTASTVCTNAHGGQADALPDEPGGYAGFNGLFGATAANQVVHDPAAFTSSTQDANGAANGNVNNLAPTVNDVYDFSHTVNPCGAPCTGFPAPSPIQDSTGNNGFPGFNPSAAQSLGYVAAMQEAGIPVTYTYIADAHDDHEACNGGVANGPGTACYVQQLAHYNQAFQAFFARLAADGIDKTNTLFVFTADEGDHYAGGPPTNPGCDGVPTPCTYSPGTTGPNTVGEISVNLKNLLSSETGDTTPLDFHFDSAPTFYIHNDPNGPPTATDPKVRRVERDLSGLTAANPRTQNQDVLTQHIADKVTQDILHMTNTDPLRTPSFTWFANADYFFQNQSCAGTSAAGCPVVGPGFAWNHGDDNPEIAKTWLGIVGPDVQNLGQTGDTWIDHTDVRPTMLAALGLQDDYASDGNVVAQALTPSALTPAISGHLAKFTELAGALKQLNAPFGQFGHDAEVVSTTAVATTSPSVYDGFDAQLTACRDQRNALAGQMQTMLNNAATPAGTFDDAQAATYIGNANSLIGNMHKLSQMNVPPNYTVCGSSDQGPTGATGPKGDTGATGPQGPAGKNGRDATVTCTVKKSKSAKKVTVSCKVTFTSTRVHEARLVLKRGSRTVSSARTVRSGRVSLRAAHGGRYRLVVSVLINGKAQTIVQRTLKL
jgi:hypothetical protein